MAKFCRIVCHCPKLTKRKGRSQFLGSIQVDIPNAAHHHCRVCNTTYEHRVSDDGLVTRKIVTDVITYSEETAIVS